MPLRALMIIGLALGLGLVAVDRAAAADLVSKTFFRGLAIKGYDATAYFRSDAPAKGDAAHTVRWRDASWRFETADAAARFEAEPDAYAPRFGGYCTRAMSEDKKVAGDPRVWRLYKGKVYLFYAEPGADLFDADPDGMIARAQGHWKRRTGLDD